MFSAEASLSLTDVSEIPDDAELAETFYSQFEDEFENDESEDEIEDEDDFSALMDQMQDALDYTGSRDDTLSEADLPSEGLTDTWRHKRIQGLRAYPFDHFMSFIGSFVCTTIFTLLLGLLSVKKSRETENLYFWPK